MHGKLLKTITLGLLVLLGMTSASLGAARPAALAVTSDEILSTNAHVELVILEEPASTKQTTSSTPPPPPPPPPCDPTAPLCGRIGPHVDPIG